MVQGLFANNCVNSVQDIKDKLMMSIYLSDFIIHEKNSELQAYCFLLSFSVSTSPQLIGSIYECTYQRFVFNISSTNLPILKTKYSHIVLDEFMTGVSQVLNRMALKSFSVSEFQQDLKNDPV